MCDLSIRRVSIAEQARHAAWRFIQTGEPEPNPHEGTADELAWRTAFGRWCASLTVLEGTETSA